MKKIIPILMLLSIAALISVSCKSTPPPGDSAFEPEVKAQAARQRAVDFESPAYFPSEWEEVETKLAIAGQMPRSNATERQEAENAYNSAAAAYDEIFAMTVPLYAQAREDEILSTRETLIETGFTQYFPEYLKTADDMAIAAQDQYDAEDYYGARDTAAKALNEYETLLVGAGVYLARREVMDRAFIKYDEANFIKAEEISNKAIEDFEAGNRDAALAGAEEALLRYNIILENGWTNYAGEMRISAGAERELALRERANIASRDMFREADILYNRAEENLALQRFHEAAVMYTDAEALFAISRHATQEKRLRAEDAIRTAGVKIEESNEAAIEADRIIEGGSR